MKITSIRGKNGELRNGILKWIDIPDGEIGEFWFYDGINPMGIWCKLDYWEIISEDLFLYKLTIT